MRQPYTMNRQRCKATITEQTFSHYRNRCVPCFNRPIIRSLKRFCSETLPFLALLFFVIPAFVAFHLALKLWHTIGPVPFRRSEIARRMTPHFGLAGALEYVKGLKKGFHGGIPRRVCFCGTHTRHSLQETSVPPLCYTIGREDGIKLRGNSKQLEQILDQRCSSPYQCKLTKPPSPKPTRLRSGITLPPLHRRKGQAKARWCARSSEARVRMRGDGSIFGI